MDEDQVETVERAVRQEVVAAAVAAGDALLQAAVAVAYLAVAGVAISDERREAFLEADRVYRAAVSRIGAG